MRGRRHQRPAERPTGATDLWTVIASVLVVAAFVVMPFDPTIQTWAHSVGGGTVAIFRVITNSGNAQWFLVPSGFVTVWLASVAMGLGGGQAARPAAWLSGAFAFVFTAVATSGILVNIVKVAVGRARPRMLERDGFYGFDPLGLDSDFRSFPSGHANTAFAFALAVGLLVPPLRLPLAIWAVLVAASRVVVGAHWPADVFAGAAVAVVTTIWIARGFAARGWVFRMDGAGRLRPTPAGRLIQMRCRRALRRAAGAAVPRPVLSRAARSSSS
ncbi:MAG: phosphatase PAP2 family protein [Azospirillaceae bacterium]